MTPGTFQAAMNNVFIPPDFGADGSLNPKYNLSVSAVVFTDDIPVFSTTAVERALHLELVFSELVEHKVVVKAPKCVCFKTE